MSSRPRISSPTSASPSTLRGMLLVALSALGFSCMHGLIRHLSGELHPFEIAFFRNLFGLLALTPFFLRYGTRALHTRRFSAHLLRGTLQVAAMLLFFTALTLAPLAEVSALSFSSPLFATVGAVLLLGEHIHLRRIAALVLGFGGALVILQPGVVPVGLGSLLVLASSAVWALTMLLIKPLTRSESSLTLTAYMGLVMSPLSLLPALTVWRWLAGMGALGAASQYAMAEAFQGADTTAVLPVDFTRLVWASLIGYLFFAEVPAMTTWIGGAVIFASTTYIAWREARQGRAAAGGPPRGVGPESRVEGA
jgi:drug/metabolite transporter (DMT)-like permease